MLLAGMTSQHLDINDGATLGVVHYLGMAGTPVGYPGVMLQANPTGERAGTLAANADFRAMLVAKFGEEKADRLLLNAYKQLRKPVDGALERAPDSGELQVIATVDDNGQLAATGTTTTPAPLEAPVAAAAAPVAGAGMPHDILPMAASAATPSETSATPVRASAEGDMLTLGKKAAPQVDAPVIGGGVAPDTVAAAKPAAKGFAVHYVGQEEDEANAAKAAETAKPSATPVAKAPAAGTVVQPALYTTDGKLVHAEKTVSEAGSTAKPAAAAAAAPKPATLHAGDKPASSPTTVKQAQSQELKPMNTAAEPGSFKAMTKSAVIADTFAVESHEPAKGSFAARTMPAGQDFAGYTNFAMNGNAITQGGINGGKAGTTTVVVRAVRPAAVTAATAEKPCPQATAAKPAVKTTTAAATPAATTAPTSVKTVATAKPTAQAAPQAAQAAKPVAAKTVVKAAATPAAKATMDSKKPVRVERQKQTVVAKGFMAQVATLGGIAMLAAGLALGVGGAWLVNRIRSKDTRQVLADLKEQNTMLRDLLKQNNIDIPQPMRPAPAAAPAAEAAAPAA